MASNERIEIYRDKKNEYRWRLIVNGRIKADSGGDGYKREFSCWKALQSLPRQFGSAAIVRSKRVTRELAGGKRRG